MEKEMLKAKPLLRKGNRLLNASLCAFDLPNLVETMKHKQTWVDGELNAMILLRRPDRQIVLTALHQGTEIKSFQANDSVTFQIIEGKLMLRTRKQLVTLEKGQLLTLHENVKYSLTSDEDTVFLLTITNGALQPGEN